MEIRAGTVKATLSCPHIHAFCTYCFHRVALWHVKVQSRLIGILSLGETQLLLSPDVNNKAMELCSLSSQSTQPLA